MSIGRRTFIGAAIASLVVPVAAAPLTSLTQASQNQMDAILSILGDAGDHDLVRKEQFDRGFTRPQFYYSDQIVESGPVMISLR